MSGTRTTRDGLDRARQESRLGLYRVKPWFVRALRPVEDALVARRVSPDALTAAAVVVSAATGAAIALGGAWNRPVVWLAVPPLVVVRLALNALDGSVARRTGAARPAGAVLNEAGDRASDTFVLGALTFVVPPALALGALAAAYLASLAGVTGAAVARERLTSGPMGKADRAAVVALAAVAAAAGIGPAFEVAAWVVLCGSLATAALRFTRAAAAAGGAR